MNSQRTQSNGTRPTRSLALLAFALLLAGLFLGFAVFGEVGSASLPDGTVAIVEGAPDDLAEITEAEFNRALEWRAEEAQLSRPPQPGDEKYDELRDAALGRLLSAVWIQSEAEERGIGPSHRQLTRQIRTSSPIQYLRERGSTEEEIEESAKVELLVEEIEDALEEPVVRTYRGKVGSNALEKKKTEAFLGFDAHMRGEWQLRTRCADGFVMEQCGNVSPFIHPSGALLACYEADPETPPEGCPAPVIQSQPALPGSVTVFWPQGERLAQRPLPEPAPGQ